MSGMETSQVTGTFALRKVHSVLLTAEHTSS